MPNEVVIHVTSRNDTAKGFASARKDVETFADDSADLYQKRFAKRMEMLGRNLTTPLQQSGKEIGERLGNSSAGEITRVIGDRITETLVESVTKGVETHTTEFHSAGETIGDAVGEGAGDRAGRSMSERIVDHITRRIKTRIRTVGDDISGDSGHAGERIGEDISKTIHTKIKDKIKTSVDVDTDGSLRSKAEGLGKDIGDKVGDGVGGTLTSFFSGDLISLLVKGLAAGALATALAPVIGAGITGAILLGLGGGVLAAGIIAAFKDPRIAAAGNDLKKTIGDAFTEFGKPFRVPVAETMEKLSRFVKTLAPDFKRLGDLFAPIVGQLGTAFVSLLQNAMPGILAAVEASAPLFETLAKHMPAIGDAIGKFFKSISDHGSDANILFGDILTVIEKLIPMIGSLISFLASGYSRLHNIVVNSIDLANKLKDAWTHGLDIMKAGFLSLLLVAIDTFGKILAGASAGLSWIPGIGPKLRGAQEKFNHFREGVNKELKKLTDKQIRITFKVFGLAVANAAVHTAEVLASMGYASGGIKGAASGMNTSGLTWVGERGPELVSIPTGSTVHSSGDSMRMMRQGMEGAGGGMGGTILLRAAPGASRDLMSLIIEGLRYEIDRNGQGSAQRFLGSTGVA